MARCELDLLPPFEELMRRHEREIMRFLLRITGERADALDLFQDTWLRAYRAYPKLQSASGLRPWLYRIAGNLWRNHARDRARRARVMSGASGHRGEAAGAAHDATDGRIQVRQLVAELPFKQRQALLMRQRGFGYGEIGAALECSAQSARANVSLAVRKIKASW